MRLPPPLPEEILRRVIGVARFHGMSLLVVASTFAILSAKAGDSPGTVVGLAVAGAGAMELHGEGRLRIGDAGAMNWLIVAQVSLMAAMLTYCSWRLGHEVLPPIPPHLNQMIELASQQMGMTREAYLRFVYRLGYQLIAGGTLIYQGSMMLYYFRRRGAVGLALAGAD